MNDSSKPILLKHLHAKIKSIKDFHDVSVYSITKETLDNICLQLLKENISRIFQSILAKSGI